MIIAIIAPPNASTLLEGQKGTSYSHHLLFIKKLSFLHFLLFESIHIIFIDLIIGSLIGDNEQVTVVVLNR